jgi:HPt (histidine-containing phosphotransfer) domain-containing protein
MTRQEPYQAAPEASAFNLSAPLSPPEGSDPAELVDFSAWASITSMAQPGRPSLLKKLLTAYLTDARPLVDQIREAVASHNSATLHAAAHRLKSSSATLGAMTVASLCRQLEECGRHGQIEEARPLVPKLAQDFEAVSAVFHQELTKQQAA